MLGGASEWLTEIPDGADGSIATLHRMADIIRTPDPAVDALVEALSIQNDDPRELVRVLFEWVRRKMFYTPDFNNGTIIEEIRSPAYLLTEIYSLGSALGDCDDYVVLYGAILHRLGFPVTLEAVSTHPDRQLDHVYLSTVVDSERIPMDGIVDEPFCWEIPENEITNRLAVTV
jgi:hypothetical protein